MKLKKYFKVYNEVAKKILKLNIIVFFALSCSVLENNFQGTRNIASPDVDIEQNCVQLAGNFLNLENVAQLELRTKRLSLKPVLSEDQINELILIFSKSEVQEMSGDVVDSYLLHSLVQMGHRNLEEAQSSGRPFINFAIYFNDKIVGMTQIATGQENSVYQAGIAQLGEKWVSISYHLDPSVWGSGIATELGERTTKFAFEKLGVSGIHGEALKNNSGSKKVLVKLGFTQMDFVDPVYDHFYLKNLAK